MLMGQEIATQVQEAQRVKRNEKHRNMFKTKEQDKNPEKDLNEMEISDLPDKELKIMVIKMHTKVRRTMYEQSENFNKEKV